MVLVTPKEQLNRLLASLYNEGVLDRQFDQLRRLQDDDNPGFIVDVLTVFCRESDSIIIEIDRLLERPPLDYPRIVAYVHQLKGSCSRVQHALNRVKLETFRLRINFQTVIELERKILINSITAYQRSRALFGFRWHCRLDVSMKAEPEVSVSSAPKVLGIESMVRMEIKYSFYFCLQLNRSLEDGCAQE